MSIGVSHDVDTGTVVLVDKAARKIYDFAPIRAEAVASDLRAAGAAGGAVLIVATADGGRQVRIGGDANYASRWLMTLIGMLGSRGLFERASIGNRDAIRDLASRLNWRNRLT